MFELIRTKNEVENNQLVITTHSHYIINYLTLAIKKNAEACHKREELLEKLNKVVPSRATIALNQVSVYQLNDKGEIKKLPDYNDLPTDENYLNNHLNEANDLFIELLALEEKGT